MVITILGVVLLQLVISVLFLAIGFWAGRKTQDKEVFTIRTGGGGQPVLDEYSPWEEAMGEDKLISTVER